jgi:phasin family protein
MTIEEAKLTEKVKTAARATKAAAETTVDTAKDQFARAAETQFKAADEAAALGKSNAEAFIQAGSIFFHGMEELTRSVFGMTQFQVETSLSAAKSLIAAKTLTEFTDLQNAYSKTVFDNAMADATKISELALKITNQAIEPISQRVTATFEHIAKPVFTPAA